MTQHGLGLLPAGFVCLLIYQCNGFHQLSRLPAIPGLGQVLEYRGRTQARVEVVLGCLFKQSGVESVPPARFCQIQQVLLVQQVEHVAVVGGVLQKSLHLCVTRLPARLAQ